jgi:hypothetical protein
MKKTPLLLAPRYFERLFFTAKPQGCKKSGKENLF